MMRRRQGACGGFTLVELLVATAVTLVVTALVAGVLASTNSFWTTGNVRMNITEEAQRGLVKMLSDLRLTEPAQVTIATTTQPNDTLNFNLPAMNGNDVVLDPQTGRVIYQNDPRAPGPPRSYRFVVVPGPGLLGGQLVRQQLNGGGGVTQTVVLANRVQSLTFAGASRNPAPPPVTIPASASPEQVTIAMTTLEDMRPAGGARLASTEATAAVQFRNELYRPTFTSGIGSVRSQGNTLPAANLDPSTLPNI